MDSDRLRQLEEFRSTVTAKQMKTLHSKFDIPTGFKLTAPAKSAAVYHHGEGKAPLYLSHLECGLRLPLHPFLRKVFEALGVSPMQLTPNSIAMLVGFMAICSWLGIVPSMEVLSHLVNVMAHKAAHYHLQTAGDFKIVLDLPSSHKGWKEKFVWVEGDDSNLDCSSWPEIRKGVLDPRPLTSAEKGHLEQIMSYTGPRTMGALLNKSVLRLHGISSLTPTKRDETVAHNVTFGGLMGSEEATKPSPSDESSREHPQEPASTAVKRPRDKVADEGVSPTSKRREATKEVVFDITPRPDRRRLKKTSHGPRGAKLLGERSDAPMEVESADYDDDLPPEPSVDKPAAGPAPVLDRVGTQPGTRSAAPGEGTSHLPGKKPIGARARSSEARGWPSAYYLAESDTGSWAKTRDLMIGRLPPRSDHEEDPDPTHLFVPAHGLDARSSVLESRLVQAKVVEQFRLPKDEELFRNVPDLGLHAILRSYLARGCLVEDELHRRLAQGHHAYEKLQKASVGSRETNDAELDRVVADLSMRQAELDNWRREEEQMLAELKSSDSKKSIEIQRLKQRLDRVVQESGSAGRTSELLEERD